MMDMLQMPDVSLLQPMALLGLLLIPIMWRVAGPRLRSIPRGQRRMALLTRSAIILLLMLALAEPIVQLTPRALQVVFAVDRSASLNEAQRQWLDQWLQGASETLATDDRAATIGFHRRAGPLSSTAPEGAEAQGSNIEAALRSASALLPRSDARHIVLLTDGWQTEGNALQSEVLTDGATISYVAPPAPEHQEVSIRSLDVPPHTRVGEPLDATITVDSLKETEATLRVWMDERLVTDQSILLVSGPNQLSVNPFLRTTGFHHLRAEILTPGDERAENNAAAASTVAKDAGRVLVLEERPGEGREIASVLANSGASVELQAIASIPTNASALSPYDAIVLANVPATSLTLDKLRTLQIYVQDMGRGLVVSGGERAYAPGGYEGSILDEMLPVSSSPPARRRQGSVALLLVIDKSGSMDLFRSDVSKIAMAREAAIQATGLLQVDDTLGVLAFDNRLQWVVPTARLRTPDDLKRAQASISAIRADGGTSIFPALEAAYLSIAPVEARLKHIVLLTDGQSFNADYAGLIQRMRPRDITLSTVAVGSDADTKLLTTLANIGEGRYYFTERSTEIPRIASKEANILTRNATVEGDINVLMGEASPILRGIDPGLPSLDGYVGTTPRPRAVTALGTDRGDPLLAHWQYGLGRVVAWTSDTHGSWSDDWLKSADAMRIWSQAVRWAMPEPQRPDLRVSTHVDGQWVTLRAETVKDDGTFGDLLDTRATVVNPLGEAIEAKLPQRGPGVYELRTQLPAPGVYRVLFSQHEQGRVAREELSGFTVLAGPETRGVGLNRPLLEQLAARTGGRELTNPADLEALERAPLTQVVPLWPWLVGLALLLLPLDIAIRRLQWPWFGQR